jgi:catechol 2,3-dioxygenase-like lactoylglutathione lyase family enzyme
MNILKPHVSLNVSNVDASVAFYERVFGVKASKRRPGYAKFDLEPVERVRRIRDEVREHVLALLDREGWRRA